MKQKIKNVLSILILFALVITMIFSVALSYGLRDSNTEVDRIYAAPPLRKPVRIKKPLPLVYSWETLTNPATAFKMSTVYTNYRTILYTNQ